MSPNPDSHALWWFLVAWACAFLTYVFFVLRKRWRSIRARYRTNKGLRAERNAERWLERLGYRVLGRQVARAFDLSVDGTPMSFPLRADYVVEAQGKRYVAEVKSGVLGSTLTHAATRRQLLEYRVAYDVDGVLFVDAKHGRVQEVTFSTPPSAPPFPSRTLFIGLLLGSLTTLLIIFFAQYVAK